MEYIKIEDVILSNLILNFDYTKKVFPHLKEEYFSDNDNQILFNLVSDFIKKYKKLPTRKILAVELEKKPNISEESVKSIISFLREMKVDKETSLEWLTENTEKYCRDKAITDAIHNSIVLLDNEEEKQGIPKLLENALSISFFTKIGHDYFEDYQKRWDFYNTEEEKIPFDLPILNKITKGGLLRKTLTILMAPSGIGKSTFMCHFAASQMMLGYNVLYISLEMSEEMIGERIDQNIMGLTDDQLHHLSNEKFKAQLEAKKKKCNGRMIIQEFPARQAGAAHFRHLINELRFKKKFTPDIIYVDYVNICKPTTVQYKGAGLYDRMKDICEELRSLASEFDVPIVSATQVNRDGMTNTDFEVTDTAESVAIVHTSDLMLGIISMPELEERNQIKMKQLKNRRYDVNKPKNFIIGIDRSRMRLYNIEDDDVVTDSNDVGHSKSEDKIDKNLWKGVS